MITLSPRPGVPSRSRGGQGAIIVGDDVFIGARATILPGVHIGDGAAIGAGAVVTRAFRMGAWRLAILQRSFGCVECTDMG